MNTNFKTMFAINGYELRSRNNGPVSKQISLHGESGLLANYPLATECDNYKGIDDCMIEMHRFLKPCKKLTFTKGKHSIELFVHWSKEYNQYRITFSKPDSKYKPCTAYEDDLTSMQDTFSKIVYDLVDIKPEYTKRIIDRLKIVVASKLQENNW